MADQGRWFKLWVAAISDPSLRELSLEDIGRWCWLGAYLKAHGNAGKLTVKLPGCALQDLFRVGSWDHVALILQRFPNCETVCDTVSCTVTWNNWSKYQVDNSYERVKKWRQTVTARDNVTKKRREEKRREKDISASLSGDASQLPGKKSPNPSVKPLIDHYHTSFVARFKSSPLINGSKCGAIAKKLLAGRTLDEAKWLVTEHLSNPPDFYEGKNLYGLEHVLASAQTLLARRAKSKGATHDG